MRMFEHASSPSPARSRICATAAIRRRLAVAEHAAEDLRAGRGAGDLLDLGFAIDREEAHAERIGAGDVALLLDRVAEADAIRRRAGRQHLLDLGDRGRVEARAEAGEKRKHLRIGIGLDGIEDARVRQGLGEGGVIVAHDFEVERQGTGRPHVPLGVGTQEFLDTIRHRGIPSKARCTAQKRTSFGGE